MEMQTKVFKGETMEDCRKQLQEWVLTLDNFEVTIISEDSSSCEIAVSYRIIEC